MRTRRAVLLSGLPELDRLHDQLAENIEQLRNYLAVPGTERKHVSYSEKAQASGLAILSLLDQMDLVLNREGWTDTVRWSRGGRSLAMRELVRRALRPMLLSPGSLPESKLETAVLLLESWFERHLALSVVRLRQLRETSFTGRA